MKIKKYFNGSLFLIFVIVTAICTLALTYIKSENNKSLENLVEKNIIDDVSIKDSSKTLETVEEADEKITTKIGEKELYVKSYYNNGFKDAILNRPSDHTIEQCRVALDMMVRILNGEKPGVDFPFQSGPDVSIISKDNISQFIYEELFGTRDYIPVLNHMNE